MRPSSYLVAAYIDASVVAFSSFGVPVSIQTPM